MSFLASISNLFKILLASLIAFTAYPFIKNRAIYFFLKVSGPTFIKLGQLLSTRPDLVGDGLSEILSSFQDKLPNFSYLKSKKTIEEELKKPISELFLDFNKTPIASASIAQVHKATLFDGTIVAVKILRPNISKLMARDVATLKLIAVIIGIFSKYTKEKITDIIKIIEISKSRELDMTNEAAVASELKEKLVDLKGFYIPKIYWNYVTAKVLVMEWIDGIPFSNKEKIKNSPFDKKQIAENLVISYFNQVYIQGLFHADMHPGNLFLMANGDIGVVDFGIVGLIDKKTRIAVAEILMAFLKRDYKKVAKLHIDAGLVPNNVDINEFALTSRIIGESIIDKSVNQISLGTLLGLLLKMTRKYNMKTKPELLLLQKTMMLVEGVGVSLDPNLNMWELARPWMKEWAIKNIGFDAKIRDAFLNLFDAAKDFLRK